MSLMKYRYNRLTTDNEHTSNRNALHMETPEIPTDNIINKIKEPHYYSNTVIDKYNRPKNLFRMYLLLFILVFSGISMGFIQANSDNSNDIQKEIAQEIIRFHVIANSDSENDQGLKYKIKEKLVKELSPLLKETEDISAAREVLIENMELIKQIAMNTVEEYGYHYPITVTLEPWYFPLKVYGNYTFPPGTYEALRVQIGKAEGKNWWCVMFPPLCFVEETYSVVDESTEKQLKHLLTEEEYESLTDQNISVKVKFKLLDSIRDFFER